MQPTLFDYSSRLTVTPLCGQLLKWIGNKQRFAQEIVSYFPTDIQTYHEPFIGSGAVLGTLAPTRGKASDTFKPLVEIWEALRNRPAALKEWYATRWSQFTSGDRQEEYEHIKAAYNACPNGADLVFLCRSCYGGVVRFRMRDGYMSTPIGPHMPISPDSFAKRVDEWHNRTQHTEIRHMAYEEAMSAAHPGDLIYCDPPYSDSQSILYGAQTFSLHRLMEVIADCKNRGVRVVLSIDGTKQSGAKNTVLPIPQGLFESEVLVDCGRSMLKRFQMAGETLEEHCVSDRLLLTYPTANQPILRIRT